MAFGIRDDATYRLRTHVLRASDPLRALNKKALPRLRAEPGKVRDILAEEAQSLGLAEWIAQAQGESDSPFALPESVVFPKSLWPAHFTGRGPSGRWTLDVDDADDLKDLTTIFRGDWTMFEPDDARREVAEAMVEGDFLVKRAQPRAKYDRPGVYRLQHASLLIRSETSAVITDPVFGYGGLDFPNPDGLTGIDGVVISHSHGDHFSPACLASFGADTPIIVPKVERASMLCEDMAGMLRAAGFTNVIEAEWYSTHRLGDIDVHVYPFYGENPWVTFGEPVPGLRNAGNTYLFDADGHTTWILIDAGVEYGHSMVDVAHEVRDRHGPLTAVASNLRLFPWQPGQIDGSGRFLFCFPEELLNTPDRWPFGHPITLGPEGVRALVDICEPQHFLPYAHWWQPPLAGPMPVDKTTEAALLDAVINAPSSRPLQTSMVEWTIGQRFSVTAGGHAIDDFVTL